MERHGGAALRKTSGAQSGATMAPDYARKLITRTNFCADQQRFGASSRLREHYEQVAALKSTLVDWRGRAKNWSDSVTADLTT